MAPTSPEQRTGLGIHMLAGGKGVFPSMTVRQNLVMGAYQYRHDSADVERRIAKVLDIFPDLGGRQDQAAGGDERHAGQALAPAHVVPAGQGSPLDEQSLTASQVSVPLQKRPSLQIASSGV